MRVLLLGATGFIGRELCGALIRRGHEVVPGVRNAVAARALGTERAPVTIDFERDIDPAAWAGRLEGIDAIVNCVGILQSRSARAMRSVHAEAPRALYAACAKAGVRRVVHISAISADRDAPTDYARTKLAAEESLAATALEWVILRPSLVVARGAFGGTALLRALAAFPFAIPVPGGGDWAFQPLDVDDLGEVVIRALESDDLVRRSLEPVGPETVGLRALLEDYRAWLGYSIAPVVAVPMALVSFAARVGDLAGGPLNSTALAQLQHGNTGDYARFAAEAGVAMRGWKRILAEHPSSWQDRWHARLYFVRPLLRYTLAFLWIASAFAGAVALGQWAPALAFHLGVPIVAAGALLAAACAADLVVGVLVAIRWRPRVMAATQVAMILGYTLVVSVFWPALWLQPMEPIVKNLPILAAALALGALEEDR